MGVIGKPEEVEYIERDEPKLPEVAPERVIIITPIKKPVREPVKEPVKERFHQEMGEGYRAMAGQHVQFAKVASKIAHEILPEWEEGSDSRTT